MTRFLLSLAAAGVLVAATAAHLPAQPAADAVFTAEQAAAGARTYAASCASCHAADLGGRPEAPQLAGSDFMFTWSGQTTLDLFRYVQGMPPGGPRLTEAEYLTIVAFILEQNGATPGATPYAADTAVPIKSVATGERPGGRR
ncbi:MAG: c-type cytochrome [Vicinamibacterales bacterium]